MVCVSVFIKIPAASNSLWAAGVLSSDGDPVVVGFVEGSADGDFDMGTIWSFSDSTFFDDDANHGSLMMWHEDYTDLRLISVDLASDGGFAFVGGGFTGAAAGDYSAFP